MFQGKNNKHYALHYDVQNDAFTTQVRDEIKFCIMFRFDWTLKDQTVWMSSSWAFVARFPAKVNLLFQFWCSETEILHEYKTRHSSKSYLTFFFQILLLKITQIQNSKHHNFWSVQHIAELFSVLRFSWHFLSATVIEYTIPKLYAKNAKIWKSKM